MLESGAGIASGSLGWEYLWATNKETEKGCDQAEETRDVTWAVSYCKGCQRQGCDANQSDQKSSEDCDCQEIFCNWM